MLRTGSKVRAAFVKEAQGEKGPYYRCQLSVSIKTPNGWDYENYSSMVFGKKRIEDGTRLEIKDFAVTQNKGKNGVLYFNLMVFDYDLLDEQPKELVEEEVADDEIDEDLPF